MVVETLSCIPAKELSQLYQRIDYLERTLKRIEHHATFFKNEFSVLKYRAGRSAYLSKAWCDLIVERSKWILEEVEDAKPKLSSE